MNIARQIDLYTFSRLVLAIICRYHYTTTTKKNIVINGKSRKAACDKEGQEKYLDLIHLNWL